MTLLCSHSERRLAVMPKIKIDRSPRPHGTLRGINQGHDKSARSVLVAYSVPLYAENAQGNDRHPREEGSEAILHLKDMKPMYLFTIDNLDSIYNQNGDR